MMPTGSDVDGPVWRPCDEHPSWASTFERELPRPSLGRDRRPVATGRPGTATKALDQAEGSATSESDEVQLTTELTHDLDSGVNRCSTQPTRGDGADNDDHVLVGSDGGVFTFGEAKDDGSVPGLGVTINNGGGSSG
jgi:hypothetical protein